MSLLTKDSINHGYGTKGFSLRLSPVKTTEVGMSVAHSTAQLYASVKELNTRYNTIPEAETARMALVLAIWRRSDNEFLKVVVMDNLDGAPCHSEDIPRLCLN